MKISFFLPYLAVMAISTLLVGLIYLSVQQNYRMDANDPQLQIAHDLQDRLRQGKAIDRLIPDSIDLSLSLSPFVVLYDHNQRPLKSSGVLNGHFPQLPVGVFDFVQSAGQENVTWQPNARVRMAMVVLRSEDPAIGYIAVGRSLREVEIREANLGRMALICWLGILGVTIICAFILFRFRKNS